MYGTVGPTPTTSCVLCVLQAQAFAVSGRDNQVQAYAFAVADAINTGGAQATQAYAAAFSSAYAGACPLLLLLSMLLWWPWKFRHAPCRQERPDLPAVTDCCCQQLMHAEHMVTLFTAGVSTVGLCHTRRARPSAAVAVHG